jgi:hypothetical protein
MKSPMMNDKMKWFRMTAMRRPITADKSQWNARALRLKAVMSPEWPIDGARPGRRLVAAPLSTSLSNWRCAAGVNGLRVLASCDPRRLINQYQMLEIFQVSVMR